MTKARIPAALLVGCASLACIAPPGEAVEQAKQAAASEPAPAAAQREPAPTKAEPANTAPTAKPAARGGQLWVNVRGVGLHVLDAEGWRPLYTPRATIEDLVEIGGVIHVLTSFGVSRVDDQGQATPRVEFDEAVYATLGQPRALAGHRRNLWVAGTKRVARWDGTWHFDELTDMVPASTSPSLELGVDHRGQAWLSAAGVVLEQAEGSSTWTPVEASFAARAELPVPLAVERETALAIPGCTFEAGHFTCEALRARGPERARAELPALACPPRALAIGPRGKAAIVVSACGFVRLDLDAPDLDPRLTPDTGPAGHEVVLDGVGRAWLGTDAGLRVLEADDRLVELPLARLDGIAGAVTGLVARGQGPALPALAERPRKGGLQAKLVCADTREAIAGASVEVCSEGAPTPASAREPTTGRPSPSAPSICAGVEPSFTTTTASEGSFSINALPIGHYRVAVEVGGRWRSGEAKQMIMREGMGANIGTLEIDCD